MKKILTIFISLWTLSVIIFYLIKYPIPYFLERAIELSLFCLIIFISYNIGYFLLRNFTFNAPIRMPLFVGTGLASLSIITFFIGVFGALYKPVFYVIFLILFVISLVNFRFNINLKLPQLSFKNLLYLAILLMFIIPAFVGALAPPSFYDSLVYHLSVPSQYVKNNKIFFIESNLFANFPQNIEMLYTMALVLYNDTLANLLHFLFLPLTLLLLYGFLLQEQGESKCSSSCKENNSVPLLAILIFVTTPAIILISSGTYIDMGLTFYLFLSFICLMEWIKNNDKRLLILAGLFSGFSAGIKYIAIISIFIFIFIIIYNSIKTKQNIFILVCLFVFANLIIISPWLIKNYIFTKNPLFPFFIFSEAPLYIKKYLNHVANHGSYGFASFIGLPWDLTMAGFNFGGGFDIIGPLYLVFLPTLLFIKGTGNSIKIGVFYLIAYFVIWSLSAKVLRFLIPVFPIAAIVFSSCILRLLNYGSVIKSIAKIILIVIITSNFFILIFIQNIVSPVLYVFGNLSRDEYFTRFLRPNNPYPAIEYMNERLTSDSKVLFVGEARNYFTKLNTVAPSPFDPDILTDAANKSENAEELFLFLKKEGFTNILWNYPEYERLKNGFRPNDFTNKSSNIIDKFKNKYLNLLFNNENICVYGLKE